MKIQLHDGRTVTDPTEAGIERRFAGLFDAGDFVILNDDRRGELRAAGPLNGTFLLQCDLPRKGRNFAGERHGVAPAEATGIFREFLKGRVEWSGQFVSREASPSRSSKMILILAAAAAAAFLLWWLARSA